MIEAEQALAHGKVLLVDRRIYAAMVGCGRKRTIIEKRERFMLIVACSPRRCCWWFLNVTWFWWCRSLVDEGDVPRFTTLVESGPQRHFFEDRFTDTGTVPRNRCVRVHTCNTTRHVYTHQAIKLSDAYVQPKKVLCSISILLSTRYMIVGPLYM